MVLYALRPGLPGSVNRPAREPDPTARMGKGMLYLAFALALGLLTWGFDRWLDAQKTPEVKSARVAGRTEVTLTRNRYGHYQAQGQINGRAVEFLLDTGATEVSVPSRVAQDLRLQAGAPLTVMTANGAITVYATRLASVRLGEIELRDIKAHINPAVAGDEVLLGMSFLKHLDFAQRGNILTLKPVTSE